MKPNIKAILSEVYNVEQESKIKLAKQWKSVYDLSLQKLRDLEVDITDELLNSPISNLNDEVVVQPEIIQETISTNDNAKEIGKSEVISAIVFILGLICKWQGLPLPEDLVQFLNGNADTIILIGGFMLMFVNKLFNVNIKINKDK